MSKIQRRSPSRTTTEAHDLRLLLAVLRTETKLIRLRRSLSRKYSPDQPRAPAGQSDGGRWVSGGEPSGGLIDQLPRGGGRWASLDAADSDTEAPHRTLLDGGGEVLTLRIRSGRGDWDEQHKVVTPDGESRLFENDGDVQTIRDGQSGEVLSRTTFSPFGIESEATVQPAFLQAAPLVGAAAARATFEAAALLFTVLSARKGGFGTALGMTARSYALDPKSDEKLPIPVIKQLTMPELGQACPRWNDVMRETDRITTEVRTAYPNLRGKELGLVIHSRLAQFFGDPPDPKFIVEFLLTKEGKPEFYSRRNSLRLDLFELTPDDLVCVYDYKTGTAEIDGRRALELCVAAKGYHPTAKGFVIVQVKPNT